MRRRGIGRPGDRFASAAILYAASTLGIEFLRADPGRWFALGMSHSQWISGVILVGFALRWMRAMHVNRARG
jgi:prolipoprotein diacylglyceryltransferase